jgi:peroxiredoxin Q/BCP
VLLALYAQAVCEDLNRHGPQGTTVIDRGTLKKVLPWSILLAMLCLFLSIAGIIPGATTMNSVEIGSRIPSFVLKDQNGQAFDIAGVLGKKNLVIYFYPKDDTPGCTREACSFRDQFERFTAADALVIGISADDVRSHRAFADKYRLTYTLLSDSADSVRKMFGVFTGVMGFLAGRTTFVVNKEGIVVHIFNSHLQAEKHIDESLKALHAIEPGR